MQELFDLAFARSDRAENKRIEFSQAWADYISLHPWDIDVREIEPCTFEILAVMREPAPLELSMVFSEWLAALRAALDNGLYAWVATATGQNPPPKAERIQYPICSTPEEFAGQRKRLWSRPVQWCNFRGLIVGLTTQRTTVRWSVRTVQSSSQKDTSHDGSRPVCLA